jgi:trans-aconitate 2-methyltransferase
MAHEFDGKKYEKASAHQKEWGAKLIAELSLKGDERVLDLGCGDGTNTALIAGLVRNGQVVGIDASRGMIEAAKPKEQCNLKFALMDIDALAFTEEFDVIYSNATLHWVKDHRRLLANVYRCLRRDGLVRFNFAADGNCSHFFKVIRKTMAREGFLGYFKEFVWPWYMPSVEEYRLLSQNSELKDVKVWGENADRFFPDTEALIGWIDQPSLVPFLVCVAEKDKAVFTQYVVEEMIAETKQEDGRCFETFRRINLSARK